MHSISVKSPKIQLTPSEHLEFVIDKMKKTFPSNLTVQNKSSLAIACRLKCSSPKDFEFNQENLIIPGHSSASIEILYTYSISSYTNFHKFLLQTLVVKDGNSIDWKGPGVHEYKLFAKFVDFQYLPKPPEPAVEPIVEPAEPVEEKVLRVKRFLGIKKSFAYVKDFLELCFKFLATPRFNCFHLGFMLFVGVLIAVLSEDFRVF